MALTSIESTSKSIEKSADETLAFSSVPNYKSPGSVQLISGALAGCIPVCGNVAAFKGENCEIFVQIIQLKSYKYYCREVTWAVASAARFGVVFWNVSKFNKILVRFFGAKFWFYVEDELGAGLKSCRRVDEANSQQPTTVMKWFKVLLCGRRAVT